MEIFKLQAMFNDATEYRNTRVDENMNLRRRRSPIPGLQYWKPNMEIKVSDRRQSVPKGRGCGSQAGPEPSRGNKKMKLGDNAENPTDVVMEDFVSMDWVQANE